jgi:predicted metal-dependent phosphoesterase TrpH
MAGPPPPPAAGALRIDLHTHTTFSDGDLTPEALVRRALARRVGVLSITDHDSIEALPLARAAAGSALELIPGIEISTSEGGLDLHILGYFIDPGHRGLAVRLARFREERTVRMRRMVERLGELGIPVELGEVFEIAGQGVVGRPHLAEALVRAGHAENADDAFRRLLGAHGLAFVPRPAFPPAEAIALVREAGGISVLAHPGPGLVDSVVEALAARGLGGIEVWHPQHGPLAVRRYQALAERLGLVETGGSDFHGEGRSTDLGDLPVPERAITALKRAAAARG